VDLSASFPSPDNTCKIAEYHKMAVDLPTTQYKASLIIDVIHQSFHVIKQHA
jgi:hypothetical protein